MGNTESTVGQPLPKPRRPPAQNNEIPRFARSAASTSTSMSSAISHQHQRAINSSQSSSTPVEEAKMAIEDIRRKLENTDLSNKKVINILLLGETGVGKSTFINSVFNYLQFEDFKSAEKGEFNVLIPAKFSIYDKDGNLKMIQVGASGDTNEDLTSGSSATQAVKTYSFYMRGKDTQVRIIDTPGMGDTRGIEEDDNNCENILSYLTRIQHLHAICYLFKPHESRNTVHFRYCVTQIMSRLEKSACKNIVFVFTHTKGSNYQPGETLQLLRNMTEELRKNAAQADIPLDHNAFCFDNEAFRHLAAVKGGVDIGQRVRADSIESWRRSTEECWRMILYILNLPPHLVNNTSAVNEARRIIYQLAQPMADIAQLVNDNIQILNNHRRHLDIDNKSLATLKEKLYVPVIDLVVKQLTQPVTVCAHKDCCEVYKIMNETNEWHYKTRCHDPCYLQNVPRDVIGSPELMNCASMGHTQSCTKCTHSYKIHMHVYYMTEKTCKQKTDDNVSQCINTKELIIENAKKVMREVEDRKRDLEGELKMIVECNAKFAHYLQHNAIVPFNDSYAEYINYLIVRENSLGSAADNAKLLGLQRLLCEHNEMKKAFKLAADSQKKIGRTDVVTSQEICATMEKLFKLRLNGKTIRNLFETQKKSMSKEYKFSEYTHAKSFDPAAPKLQIEKNANASAQNPTSKFQRGRPNNRGNKGGRGRGSSTGPQNRPNLQRQRSHSPPPPYYGANPPNPPPNQPHRDYNYPPPGPGPYPPPPLLPNYPPPPPPAPLADRHYPSGGPRYEGNYPSATMAQQNSGPIAEDRAPTTVQVNLTLPTSSAANPISANANLLRDHQGNIPPPRDYPPRPDYYPPPRDDYHHHPRDGYPPRDPYPPRYDYHPRDGYYPPPRDHYDQYYPRDGYPPRDQYNYPPRDAYPPRDGYAPRDPPRDYHRVDHHRYNNGPTYNQNANRGGGAGRGNYHQNNDNNYQKGNYQNNQRGGHQNYRGNRGGGVNRRYNKKKQNRNDSNKSGNDSDTSAA